MLGKTSSRNTALLCCKFALLGPSRFFMTAGCLSILLVKIKRRIKSLYLNLALSKMSEFFKNVGHLSKATVSNLLSFPVLIIRGRQSELEAQNAIFR